MGGAYFVCAAAIVSSVVPICRRETGNAAIFRPTHDFPIPVVGADDSVRPRNSLNFSWPFVGVDAHIGPSKYCDFASDLRKNGHFPRADRVVRPYGEKRKNNTNSHWISIKRSFSAGRCGHRPLRRKTENAAVFHRTRAVFNTLCRGGQGRPPLRCKIETQCNNVRPPPCGGIPVWAVGWVDAHIGPAGCTIFTENAAIRFDKRRKNGYSKR